MRPSSIDFEPTDPDFASRVRDSFTTQAAMATFGVELVAVAAGSVEFQFRPPTGFTQQDGFLHAAVTGAVLDSACGYAAMSLTSAGTRVLTSGYKIDLLRPAAGNEFRAFGWVVKPGRKLTVASSELRDGQDRLIAIMTGTIVSVDG